MIGARIKFLQQRTGPSIARARMRVAFLNGAAFH
jgi:hypothetical protein